MRPLLACLLAGACSSIDYDIGIRPADVLEACPAVLSLPPPEQQAEGRLVLTLRGEADVLDIVWRPGVTSTLAFPNLDGTGTPLLPPYVDGCLDLPLDYHFDTAFPAVEPGAYDDAGGLLELLTETVGAEPELVPLHVRVQLDPAADPDKLAVSSCDAPDLVARCPATEPALSRFEARP
jgi:hypothetical protein